MWILLVLLQMSQLDGRDVVNRSIAHHDPAGVWSDLSETFHLRESRPDGSARHLEITIDHRGERFIYYGRLDGRHVFKRIVNDECSATVDGSAELSSELASRYRTSCEEIRSYRDYYDYLLGMPMKLRDPGTIIDPVTKFTIFNGARAIEVRVTYDAAVGSDVWYYYFDPESHALRGARFFHDEAARDGEVIVFEDEIEVGQLRLPQHRRWYRNRDEHYLGTDTILPREP